MDVQLRDILGKIGCAPITAAYADNDDRSVTITAGAAGSSPPRFAMTAYNGGPMTIAGFRHPVIVDGRGVTAAAPAIPVYCGHEPSNPGDIIERLFGQAQEFSVDPMSGKISAAGPVTGSTDTTRAVLGHAANGFKFQASIGAQPSRVDFLQEGGKDTVNGRSIQGPTYIARQTTVSHIAVVPLGADSSTETRIAAAYRSGDVTAAAAMKEQVVLNEDMGIQAELRCELRLARERGAR